MSNSYPKPSPKTTTLKLVTGKKSEPEPELRLGGVAPSDKMEPGKYLVLCETAWIEKRGKKHQAILQFRIVDGAYDGTGLRMWVTVSDGGGIVSESGRFARYCQLALGRPLNGDDNVTDPSQIFAGRFFLVEVGYRKTERPGGGGMASDANALRRKDKHDALRVHEILSREEL